MCELALKPHSLKLHLTLRHVVADCVLQKYINFPISAITQFTAESAVGCV